MTSSPPRSRVRSTALILLVAVPVGFLVRMLLARSNTQVHRINQSR